MVYSSCLGVETKHQLLDINIDMISGPRNHEKCQKPYEKRPKIDFSTISHPDLRGSGSYHIIIKVLMSAIQYTSFMANAPYLGLIESNFIFSTWPFFSKSKRPKPPSWLVKLGNGANPRQCQGPQVGATYGDCLYIVWGVMRSLAELAPTLFPPIIERPTRMRSKTNP